MILRGKLIHLNRKNRPRIMLVVVLLMSGLCCVYAEDGAEFSGELLPEGTLFDPMLADVKEPRFFVGFHDFKTDGQLGRFNASSVGYGEEFGLVRWHLAADKAAQLSIAGGVFAQFNIEAQSKDLINADYVIGLRYTYRHQDWSYRLRLFHQSTHLGDEFLLQNDHIERVNFSIESLDGVVSRDWTRWRAYGGFGMLLGEPEPAELDRKYAILGGEYQSPIVLWKGGHWFSGLHVQVLEEGSGAVGKSLKIGMGFAGGVRKLHNLKIMLEMYDGYMPYGQFYDIHLRSLGASIYFGF